MKKVLGTILEYGKYPSSWKGLISILAATGVVINPAVANAIIAAGMAGVGLIQVFVDE